MKTAVHQVSDDVFRNELRAAIAALRAWADPLLDVADIEIKDGKGFWRMSVRPKAVGTCPFTLVLRDDQSFDIRLATETFEDLEIDNFGLFADIARAACEGRIELRDVESAATALPKGRETRVTLGDGSVWSMVRALALPGLLKAGDADVVRVTRFVPYRRS